MGGSIPHRIKLVSNLILCRMDRGNEERMGEKTFSHESERPILSLVSRSIRRLRSRIRNRGSKCLESFAPAFIVHKVAEFGMTSFFFFNISRIQPPCEGDERPGTTLLFTRDDCLLRKLYSRIISWTVVE